MCDYYYDQSQCQVPDLGTLTLGRTALTSLGKSPSLATQSTRRRVLVARTPGNRVVVPELHMDRDCEKGSRVKGPCIVLIQILCISGAARPVPLRSDERELPRRKAGQPILREVRLAKSQSLRVLGGS